MGCKSVLSIALVAGVLFVAAHVAEAKDIDDLIDNSDTAIEKLDAILWIDPDAPFDGKGTSESPVSLEQAKKLLKSGNYTGAYVFGANKELRKKVAGFFSSKIKGEVLRNDKTVHIYGTGRSIEAFASPEAVAATLEKPKKHKAHKKDLKVSEPETTKRDVSKSVVVQAQTPVPTVVYRDFPDDGFLRWGELAGRQLEQAKKKEIAFFQNPSDITHWEAQKALKNVKGLVVKKDNIDRTAFPYVHMFKADTIYRRDLANYFQDSSDDAKQYLIKKVRDHVKEVRQRQLQNLARPEDMDWTDDELDDFEDALLHPQG
ncbi:MAG: hypothetical protein HOI80_04350 [Alphaproteobacteria bacterium]|jgi:hypothetical protein|nr:hypothetical protein [Alphaproteobacteria bacterium]MBT5389174.1 hypothetical protein [Alphaproteobacteria bacterium]MBT5654714.1 hypothetical protein [Alphaproteobacteria bacterium]